MPSGYAQKSRTALEKEKSKIRKEIDYKNQLLKETKKTKKKSLNQLVLVRKKIKNREKPYFYSKIRNATNRW